jgi:hypothetical protein
VDKVTQIAHNGMREDTLARRGRVSILAIGILLLMTGIATSVWRLRQVQQSPEVSLDDQASVRNTIDSLEKQLAASRIAAIDAKPVFEVTFAEATLETYRKWTAAGDADAALIGTGMPRVVMTDVTQRLRDSAAIYPTYADAHTKDVFLREFLPVAKRRALRLRTTYVYALLLRQVGAGRADSVVVDADRSEIDGVVEIYAPSDLVGNNEVKSKLREHTKALTASTLHAGTLETGQGAIVPLLVANFFWRTDGGNDPSGWIVADGVGYVPLRLRYRLANGSRDSISLRAALNRPIAFGETPP